MRNDWIYYELMALVLLLDQVTKWLVVRSISLYETRVVIPGFFNLTHIRNRGAIFGAFGQAGNRLVFLFLTLASLIALGFVVYYFFRTSSSERGVKFSLGLILAGALGNLIDRIVRGSVVDFLDFHIGGRHWPFFNVADSAITIGALLLIVFFLKRKPECTPSSSA